MTRAEAIPAKQAQLDRERNKPDPVRAARDLARVATNARSRLHALDVPVDDDESPEDLIAIMEAVERFENVVRGVGGDLMMDEPPRGSRAQPDGEERALPVRGPNEPAGLYIERLDRAAKRILTP